MEPVVTPETMEAADRRSAADVPVGVLMERAGRAVAWATRRELGGCYGRRAVVICGKGNNGGDGLVAARALRSWGVHVDVVGLGAGSSFGHGAGSSFGHGAGSSFGHGAGSSFGHAAGIDRGRVARALAHADVAVDAMYGTGFRGVLEDDAAWCAHQLLEWGGSVIAVDIPSGVDGRTGTVDGAAVRATVTVTFAARKPGLVFEPGRSYAGDVRVVDIGIDLGPDGFGAAGEWPPISILHGPDIARILPPRLPTDHKWATAVFVVGGSGGMTGAALLASRAAMRAGAGIVVCALPGVDAARHASGTEVITRGLPVSRDGAPAAEAVDAVLENIDRFRALAVGPGLGSEWAVRNLVVELVTRARVPLVLDADGLNALRDGPELLRARAAAGLATVLTPHDGEYARLVGAPVGDDRIAAARHLADRAHAVVLLKGATTVVAEPGGRGRAGSVALNLTGTAVLATAGTGDVLTGVVAAFVARGAPVFEAAAAAAWIHGRAAERIGPGLVAGDLVAALAPTLVLELQADQ